MKRRLRLLLLPLAIAVATGVACSSSRVGDAGTGDGGAPETGQVEAAAPDLPAPEAGMADLGMADGNGDDAICAAGCLQATDAGCGTNYDTCLAMCRQDFAAGMCLPQIRAAQLCVIAAGPDAIECVFGHTTVKPGYCETEKGTLTNCLRGIPTDAASD